MASTKSNFAANALRRIRVCLMASGLIDVATAGTANQAGGLQDALQLQPGGYAQVQGVVLENLRGCERDLPCTLRLRVPLQGQQTERRPARHAVRQQGQLHDVQLLYHPGEGEARCNDAIVRQGLAVQAGTRVQARGRHSMAGKLHMVDLCSPPDATLRILPSVAPSPPSPQ